MDDTFTRCSVCGDTDFYSGLNGPRCSNPGCPEPGNKRTLPSCGRIPGFQYLKDNRTLPNVVMAWASQRLNGYKGFHPMAVIMEDGTVRIATVFAPLDCDADDVSYMVDNKLPENAPSVSDLKQVGRIIAFKPNVKDIPKYGDGIEYEIDPPTTSRITDDDRYDDDAPF